MTTHTRASLEELSKAGGPESRTELVNILKKLGVSMADIFKLRTDDDRIKKILELQGGEAAPACKGKAGAAGKAAAAPAAGKTAVKGPAKKAAPEPEPEEEEEENEEEAEEAAAGGGGVDHSEQLDRIEALLSEQAGSLATLTAMALETHFLARVAVVGAGIDEETLKGFMDELFNKFVTTGNG